MRPLEALGQGRALQTLVPLWRRSFYCGPFSVSLTSPAGAAAWLGAGGEDVGALEGIVLRGLRPPGMIRRGLGDAVGIVDSVVTGMIRRGQSKALAYAIMSRKGCTSPLG